MIRRRVINGHVFIRTRFGGWRLVMNGYIRTRRGWRKLRRRRAYTAQEPAPTAGLEAAKPAAATLPTIPDPPSSAPDPSRPGQWLGKYADLARHGEER